MWNGTLVAVWVGTLAVALALGFRIGVRQDEVAPAPQWQRSCCSEALLSSARSIFVDFYGTEVMAPLLYQLIRFQRPRRVVELGMGYTTPFIAQALVDNAAAELAERSTSPGALHRSAYYARQHWTSSPSLDEPLDFVAVDAENAFGHGNEDNRMRAVLAGLGLLHAPGVSVLLRDITLDDAHKGMANGSVDFVWNDVSWDPTVLRNWWFKLAPGGVMALHNTVGQHDKEGEPGWAWGDLDRALRAALPSGEKWELLTFQEPHKVYQGSFSVVRRVDTVAEGRRQHLNQFRAAEPDGSGQDVWYDTGISWTAVTGWLFMY